MPLSCVDVGRFSLEGDEAHLVARLVRLGEQAHRGALGDVHPVQRHGPTLRFTAKRSTVFSSFGAKALKNHRNLEWCEGQNVLVNDKKTLKNATLDAKIGVDRAANELRNRKNGRPSYRESESSLALQFVAKVLHRSRIVW